MLPFGLIATLAVSSRDTLPDHVDLRSGYERYGLTVCQQSGPLCWDYTVVGLLEYELATHTGSATRLSPGFLEWAASETDRESNAGSNFGRAYRGLEHYGIAPLSLGGDPDAHGKGQIPDGNTMKTAAKRGRIDIHWIRFWNNTDELSDVQFQAIESEIANGHPVAVGLRWPNSTAFTSPSSNMLKVPARGAIFDGHCVALVGYNNEPSLPGGGAFLFRNSWGEKWADHGYAWMPFALLKFCINDALSVRLWPMLPPGGFESIVLETPKLAVDGVNGPNPEVQDMRGFGPAWPLGTQLFFQAKQAGQSFGLDVTVDHPGRYSVRLNITRAEDYGTFTVGVDGSEAPTVPITIDGAGPGVSRSNAIPCGTFNFKAGPNRIVFKITGHGPASSGLFIGIDTIELVPAH